MTFVPLICDFILKDEEGVASAIWRFDSIEALADPEEVDLTIDHMSAEAITSQPATVVTVPFFRATSAALLSFVARAFDLPQAKWPHTVDDDLDITFSMDGTRVRTRAILGVGLFDRVVDYSEPGGVPSVDISLFLASGEMRIWTFVLAIDAVETLIQMNTPGEKNPGGL